MTFIDRANVTMQAARDAGRPKRNLKRRSSRKKSLSPSDLRCVRGDVKNDKMNGKRSLSEGSLKNRHKKAALPTYPIPGSDFEVSLDLTTDPKGPTESDESNIPPTSSDRDTEDDIKAPKIVPHRPRWDSASDMDSLVSIAVKKAARRRKTSSNLGEYFPLHM